MPAATLSSGDRVQAFIDDRVPAAAFVCDVALHDGPPLRVRRSEPGRRIGRRTGKLAEHLKVDVDSQTEPSALPNALVVGRGGPLNVLGQAAPIRRHPPLTLAQRPLLLRPNLHRERDTVSPIKKGGWGSW